MRQETKYKIGTKLASVGVGKTEKVLASLVYKDLMLSEARWDDLRFPVQGINPPGAVSDPTRDTEDGTLLFAANATNVVAGLAQLPHSWYEGTEVQPHIHWAATDETSGDTVWRLDYKVFGRDVPIPTSWTSETITVPASQNHTLAHFSAIDMSGFGISTLILWRIARIGGDAGDTYSADAKLLEFDMHYLQDSVGSEYPMQKEPRESDTI